MPESGMRHVFVYGTLRRGQANDITRLRPTPRLLGPASVAGALYDLGAYPGLVLGGTGQVRGEVYVIAPALEIRLDAIEAMPVPPADPRSGEYRRRRIDVVVGQARVRCLVYELQPARAAGCARIDSGDWCRHVADRRGQARDGTSVSE